MRRVERSRVILLALLLLTPIAFAQTVLDEFAALSQLPAPRRLQLQQNAEQWMRWTPAEQAAFARRAIAWDALPIAQRGARREHYQAWLDLLPAEQTEVRAAAARFAVLPRERQEALRSQFVLLDSNARRGWLLGPMLGGDYAALHPLLAQLPAEQHTAMRAILRAMSPQQRAGLAVLAQRTPPQERAKLRKELLSTTAPHRDAWLQSRLER